MYRVDDDISQNALDAEFRQILLVIKPCILHINNHFHIEQYKVWLERLSESSSVEKFERNKYLVELANQIHDGVLKPPFTAYPPRGPLPRLKKYQKLPYKKDPPAALPFEPLHSVPAVKPKKAKAEESPPASDTGSWYDLSDVPSTNNLASGDADPEEEEEEDKSTLASQHTEEALRLQDQFMKQYEEQQLSRKNSSSGKLQYQNPAEKEVEALKLRMNDLIEVKNALRDTHCLTEDRKKTIENLQFKLVDLERQNEELNSTIEQQNERIAEIESTKAKELSDFKEKFTQLRSKELQLLKERHDNEIKHLEVVFQDNLHALQLELQKQIEDIKRENETKIEELTRSKEALRKAKDQEIDRLQTELVEKEQAATNEQNNEQIIHLKKCISKLDKLLQKNERDYVKKIERLKQDLQIKDMTTQVQLQTQRADLMVRNTAAKQEELKSALSNLEAKYRKMMENLQGHALETKRHDTLVIEEFKQLLDKHCIPYSI